MQPDEKDNHAVLNAAAKRFRDRVPPASPYKALMEGNIPLAVLSDSTVAAPAEYAESKLPHTVRLSRSLESAALQIGAMPPQPPTLRGRIGAFAVQAVRRVLFWYTEQIRSFQANVAGAAREQAIAFDELSLRQQRQQALLADALARLNGLASEMSSLNARGSQLERQGAELRSSLQRERTSLQQQELRLKLLLKESDRTSPEASAVSDAIEHANDSLFVEHAQAFRGDRTEIIDRLKVYAPFARDAFAATNGAPALDLGCGRGEWLELLQKLEIAARGIDWNRDFVESCREMGLDAIQGAIPQALHAIPDESVSILSAFHVLEHISFNYLLEVLDHAVRVLKPGGIVIFETPNPGNMFVASKNFYLDPTHRHPLPSEFLAFVLEARGLCDLKVLPLSPYPDNWRLPESDCPAVRFINDHFYGAQDYGIVGFRR